MTELGLSKGLVLHIIKVFVLVCVYLISANAYSNQRPPTTDGGQKSHVHSTSLLLLSMVLTSRSSLIKSASPTRNTHSNETASSSPQSPGQSFLNHAK